MVARVGVPKEIKEDEYRVGMTPSAAAEYISAGATVLIQADAGLGSGFPDVEYSNAGCTILATAKEVYQTADMIVKVKEPLPEEYGLIRPGQIVYTFFHFAADRTLLQAMLKSNATCVAYETIRAEDGSLPLLIPMSEIAGRLAAQEGAVTLQRNNHGRGLLMAGATGVKPVKTLVLGCGIVGKNAAHAAAGMGADVIICDVRIDRLRAAAEVLPKGVRTLYSSELNLVNELPSVDLVIGAVLVAGEKAPHILKRHHLRLMKPGSVVVDVAVDQGGCIETCRPTTHKNPTYVEEGVVHYCVSNMPGVVPCTSTLGLSNATLKYGVSLATRGLAATCRQFPEVLEGINVASGNIYHSGVAAAFNMPLADRQKLLDTPI